MVSLAPLLSLPCLEDDLARVEKALLANVRTGDPFLAEVASHLITAGLDRPGIEALTAYGERVGMVFQIVDDILDVVATDEELGKPAGNDLVEGVYTLPVIRALASAESSETLRRLLGSPLEPEQVDAARAIIRSNGAVGAAVDVARRYARESLEALAAVRAGGEEGRRVMAALASLGDHLIENIPIRA